LKYQSEDYFSVIDKRTGRKICDCGQEDDALLMVSYDPHNRTYTRNQFLMGQVVDIEIQKQLPTNEIVVVEKEQPKQPQKLKEHVNKLPESELQPLNL
jgi:hypothetical protein